MLNFGPKTYIQAYIEHYQSARSEWMRRGGRKVPLAVMDRFEDKFFLQSRSYGTIEVLILEMRYSSEKQIGVLKANSNRFQHLSSFLNNAIHSAGKPSTLKVDYS